MSPLKVIEDLRDALLAEAGDDHTREIAQRAWQYAFNRVGEGSARTEQEAKLAFAGFADGFCTGTHQANGTTCQHERPSLNR